MDSILALWCQNVSIFPVLIIFHWIKERVELQRVWFLKVVLKRLGFLHSEWTSGERYFIYSTTVSNVISFLPWRHAQIQNWWNLTNKIYLESCEGGGATGKPCLSKKQLKCLNWKMSVTWACGMPRTGQGLGWGLTRFNQKVLCFDFLQALLVFKLGGHSHLWLKPGSATHPQ